MEENLPPLPGHEKMYSNIEVNAPIRVTIQGQHFYLDKTDALDLASTILMTIRSTMLNE